MAKGFLADILSPVTISKKKNSRKLSLSKRIDSTIRVSKEIKNSSFYEHHDNTHLFSSCQLQSIIDFNLEKDNKQNRIRPGFQFNKQEMETKFFQKEIFIENDRRENQKNKICQDCVRLRVKNLSELQQLPKKIDGNNSNSRDMDEIIDISSDESIKSIPIKKRTKSRTKRKSKITTSVKKIAIKRKLTNNTNLKRFNGKYLPDNQKKIDDYFLVKRNPNAIKYYETFQSSKQSKKVSEEFDELRHIKNKIERLKKSANNFPIKLSSSICNQNIIADVNNDMEMANLPSSHKENIEKALFETCRKKKSIDTITKIDDNSPKKSCSSKLDLETSIMQNYSDEVTNESVDNLKEISSTDISSNSSTKIALLTEDVKNINQEKQLNFGKNLKDASINENTIMDTDMCSVEVTESNFTILTPIIDLTLDSTEKSKKSKIIKSNTPNSVEESFNPNKSYKNKQKNICPPYKIIEGTTFAVDAFRYGEIEGISHYFLTHFHADHYIGLRKNFKKPIYLSQITANLVETFLNTAKVFLNVVQLNVPFIVNNIEITAIDANHCPGAVMFCFKRPNNTLIVHTGDFRASPQMEEEPIFWNHSVHSIYLDTTYISKSYQFSTQWESIQDALSIIKTFRTNNIGEKILYICGAYLIGKEKMWLSIAQKNHFLVWTEPKRRKALNIIEDPEILSILVDDPCDAELHILPMGKINYDYLSEYLKQFSDHFDMVFAIRPSGWEKTSSRNYNGKINIVGIEYSEHSCKNELRRFVRFLQPKKIISTVPDGKSLPETCENLQSWLQNDLEKNKKSYQPSITNYIKLKKRNRTQNNNNKSKKEALELSKHIPENYSNNLSFEWSASGVSVSEIDFAVSDFCNS